MIGRTSGNQYRSSRPTSALQQDSEYSSLLPMSEMNAVDNKDDATLRRVSGNPPRTSRGSRQLTNPDDLKDYLDAQHIDLFGQEHDAPYNPKRPSAEKQEKDNKNKNSSRTLSKTRRRTNGGAPENKSDFQFTRSFIYEDDPTETGDKIALEHQPPRTQIKATDFVLVYERDLNSFITAVPAGKNNKIDTDWLGVPKKVRSYLNQVRNAGLEVSEPIEIEKADGDATTCFVGIHAPAEVLLEMAPLFNVKEKSVIHDEEDFIATLLRQHAARESGRRSSGMQSDFLDLPSSMRLQIGIHFMPTLFTVTHSELYHVGFGQWIDRLRGMWAGKDYHLHDYVTLRRLSLDRIDMEHQLFHQKDRSFIVAEMLERVIYGDAARAEFGVSRLQREGQFKASFPLHEPVEREFLLSRWASWKSMLRPQPLHVIRNYFGEKLGMYYAWMDMYTRWLAALALIGIIVFVYSQAEYGADAISREVCGLNEEDDRIMCPDCDSCPYWRLSSSCHARKIAHMWDNSSSIIYAYLLSFWAVAFMVFWEREAARLAHLWSTYDHDIEEHIYIGYTMRADLKYRNPLTGNDEPRVSARKRWSRLILSWSISLMFVAACIAASIMVILFRTYLHNRLLTEWGTASRARAVSVYVATVTNVASILTIYRVYVVVAKHLTRYEIHELKSGEESSYAVKLFLYQCINFYFPIAYVAFFKGRYIGEPGRYRRVLGMRLETCRVGGCFADTAKLMTIFFCAKQILFQCNELLLPRIMAFFKNRKRKHAVSAETLKTFPPALEYQLLNYEGEVTFEYLEMIVQYGFVTMFSSAFPLAAFFALLNNVLEIRIDAQKIVKNCRRPIAMQAKNIGIWYKMLYFITELSIWTNAFLVGFTSESPIYRTFAAHPGSFSSFSYINETVQKAPEDQNDVKACYYHTLNGPSGEDTVFGLRVWKRRMAHVITFIMVMHILRWMLENFLSQTPKSVKDLLRMERQWQMGGTSEALAARAEEKEAARAASFNTGAGPPPGSGATVNGAESDSVATREGGATVGRPRRHTLSRRRRPTKSFAQDEFGRLQEPSRNAATHARLLTPTPGVPQPPVIIPSNNRQTSEMERFKSAMVFDDDETSSNAEAAAQPRQSASSAQTSFDSYDTLTGHKHHYLDERGAMRRKQLQQQQTAPGAAAQGRASAMMPMVSTTRVSGDKDNTVHGLATPASGGEPVAATAPAQQTPRATANSYVARVSGAMPRANADVDRNSKRKAPRFP